MPVNLALSKVCLLPELRQLYFTNRRLLRRMFNVKELCYAFSSLFVFLPCFCSCKDLYPLPVYPFLNGGRAMSPVPAQLHRRYRVLQ